MTYLKTNEYIALIKHMCSKMGIDVIDAVDKDTGNYEMCGKVLGHGIKPMIDVVDAYNSSTHLDANDDVVNAIVNAVTDDALYVYGKPAFSFIWTASTPYMTFVRLCSCIKSFKVVDMNVVVTNPFYKAYNMLKARSIEEALVQADLFFPGDYTQEVYRLVKKSQLNIAKQRRKKHYEEASLSNFGNNDFTCLHFRMQEAR